MADDDPDLQALQSGQQPSLDWLMANPERWMTYMAGREAGYGEGIWDGRAEGYQHGLGVGTKASDGYESGAVAGFDAGYQQRITDEAIEKGPHVIVLRSSEDERADRLPPGQTSEEILRGAAESWGIEYPAVEAAHDLEHFDETG